MQTTLETLTTILVENLGVDAGIITPESDIVDDLGADSLDTVEITMAIEDEFNIEIPDSDAETLKTVADIVKYLDEHKEKTT